MRKCSFCRLLVYAIAAAAISVFSCKFPYEPKPFVLPEPPYKFPSGQELGSFFGTTNIKLAYTLNVNGARAVHFVDFNDAGPAPKKLKKAEGMENLSADSPLLSPDGQFVAYYLTNDLGIYGAYIQKLDTAADPVLIASTATEPHWWADSAANKLYIIYSDQIQVSQLTPNSGHTYKQEVSLAGTGTVIGAPQTIASYPMNGGLSKDGATLCTGYDQAAFLNLSGQQPAIINSGHQVCNPSIYPGIITPPRMMFLNFGGRENLTIPDSSGYPQNQNGIVGMHAVIFIVDETNTVQDFFPINAAGANYLEWQDPEWSNQPAYAAALACLDESRADGVFLKGVGIHNGHNMLIFTQGSGKLDVTSTPYVWIGMN